METRLYGVFQIIFIYHNASSCFIHVLHACEIRVRGVSGNAMVVKRSVERVCGITQFCVPATINIYL